MAQLPITSTESKVDLMCPFRATNEASRFLPVAVSFIHFRYINHTFIYPWHHTLLHIRHRAIEITHR